MGLTTVRRAVVRKVHATKRRGVTSRVANLLSNGVVHSPHATCVAASAKASWAAPFHMQALAPTSARGASQACHVAEKPAYALLVRQESAEGMDFAAGSLV